MIKKLHLHYRPQKRNGVIHEYYSVAQSYRDEQNRNQKKDIMNLGKLSKKEAEAWKLKLKIFNGDIKEVAFIDNIKFIEARRYFDVAILNQVYDSIKIENIFSNEKTDLGVSSADIFKILVLNRCLDPQAHYKVLDWLGNSYLPELMDINFLKCNKDKIFRELDNIYESRRRLQKKLYELSRLYNSGEFELYFFDGTTSYFEGVCCDIAEAGRDKTTGYQNKVILICLITDKKGRPIIWDVFSGNKHDVTEFKKIAHTMAKEFDIKKITLCFDRGVVSESNLDLIEKALESKYITGLDQNQIEEIFNVDCFAKTTRDKLLAIYDNVLREDGSSNNTNNENTITNEVKHERRKNIKNSILPTNGFYRYGKDRFYKELGVVGNKRHVISFNVQIFRASKNTRLKNIEIVKSKIEEMNKGLLVARQDRDSEPVEDKILSLLKKYNLKKIIDYKIIPTTVKYNETAVQSYKIQININQEERIKKENLDGLLVYLTDHTNCVKGIYEVTAREIVEHYKNKYVVENAFRHLKSFLDIRPFNVYLTKHIVAHVDICMTAYFINHCICEKLSEAGISLESFYSLIEANSRVCTLETGNGQPVTLLKTLSKEATQIVNLLGASSILSKGVLEKVKIKK